MGLVAYTSQDWFGRFPVIYGNFTSRALLSFSGGFHQEINEGMRMYYNLLKYLYCCIVCHKANYYIFLDELNITSPNVAGF